MKKQEFEIPKKTGFVDPKEALDKYYSFKSVRFGVMEQFPPNLEEVLQKHISKKEIEVARQIAALSTELYKIPSEALAAYKKLKTAVEEYFEQNESSRKKILSINVSGSMLESDKATTSEQWLLINKGQAIGISVFTEEMESLGYVVNHVGLDNLAYHYVLTIDM